MLGYGTCVTPGIVGKKPFCCVYLLEVNASEPMRAAVKAAQEADEARAAGHIARELDRAFDRFRAALTKEAHHRLAHRTRAR